jgi:hypothetical protein
MVVAHPDRMLKFWRDSGKDQQEGPNGWGRACLARQPG